MEGRRDSAVAGAARLLALFALTSAPLLWLLHGAGGFASNDDYYHLKVGLLLRTQGWISRFPWMDVSVFQDGWVDHQWLFHVLLVPFTYGDWVAGGQLAAAVFGGLALTAVYFVARRLGGAAPLLAPFLLLAGGWPFLYRLVQLRAQALALTLLLIGVMLLLERRAWSLFVLACLFAWTYHGALWLLGLAGIHATVVLVRERRLLWRPVLAVGLGLALGFLVNPFSPESIRFLYLHVIIKVQNRAHLPVGLEWRPYPPFELLRDNALHLLAFAAAWAGWLLSRSRRREASTFALLVATLFGVATLTSRRFIEYWPAFSALAVSLAAADLLALRDPQRERRAIAGLLLALALLVSLAGFHILELRRLLREDRSWPIYEGASAYLRAHSPPGELVYNVFWGDFAELFFRDSERRYIVGLDPTFMYAHDPARYAVYFAVSQGKLDQPGLFLARLFGARFVASPAKETPFLVKARAPDSGLTEVYRDADAVVWRVAPSPAGAVSIPGGALRPAGPEGFRCKEEDPRTRVLRCALSAGQRASFDVPLPEGSCAVRARWLDAPRAQTEMLARGPGLARFIATADGRGALRLEKVDVLCTLP